MQIGTMLKDKSGFTRIQKLIAFMIISLLAGVCVFAATGYQSASYMLTANTKAKDVFDTAQKLLKQKKENNILEEFNLKARYYGKSLPMKLQKEILASRYKGNDFKSWFKRYEERYQDAEIRYILLESEDLEKEKREDNPLYDMLQYVIFDDRSVSQTYLVEYDASSGVVRALFYSEKVDEFEYGKENEARSNVVQRSSEALKDKWQGYYGIEAEDLL